MYCDLVPVHIEECGLTVLAGFVGVMFVVLVVFLPGDSLLVGVSFLVGALLSGTAGWIGMRTATSAAVRTTAAARTSLAGITVFSFLLLAYG